MCVTPSICYRFPWAWGVSNRCGAHFWFRSVSPFTTWCQKWDSNRKLVKISAHQRGSCLSVILHWQLQTNNFFLEKHRLNLRKEENLSFDNIMFINDSSVINKISFFDQTTCSQSGRGEVGMFILSIHCLKKSLTSKNMILCKGKNPWKVNLNEILNDWNQISGKLQNCDLNIKVYFSF